jgi:hypothetical protein
MANVCWNRIVFFGEADQITKIKNDSENESLHEGLNIVEDFSLIDYEGSLIIYCGTKWSPPVEWVEQISFLYGVTIECEYEEIGADICGVFGYSHGNKVFNLEFTYLEGKYNLLEWSDFLECEVFNRIEDNENVESFLEDFDFVSDEHREELITIFNEGV